MIKSGAGPTITNYDGLILIQIDQVEDNRHASMTTWARPLRDDLYEISRPLSLISGFDVGDVVKAIAPSGQTTPTVIEIIQKGGYRTLHVAFIKGVSIDDQQAILDELSKWNATYEMSFERFYTVVIPQFDYDAVCEYLKSLSSAILRFEPDVDISTLILSRFLES